MSTHCWAAAKSKISQCSAATKSASQNLISFLVPLSLLQFSATGCRGQFLWWLSASDCALDDQAAGSFSHPKGACRPSSQSSCACEHAYTWDHRGEYRWLQLQNAFHTTLLYKMGTKSKCYKMNEGNQSPSITKHEPGTYLPRQLRHCSLHRSMLPSPHPRTSCGRTHWHRTKELTRMLLCQSAATPPWNFCKLEDVLNFFEQTHQVPFPSWQQPQMVWPSSLWRMVSQQPLPFSSWVLASVGSATRPGPCWTLWS